MQESVCMPRLKYPRGIFDPKEWGGRRRDYYEESLVSEILRRIGDPDLEWAIRAHLREGTGRDNLTFLWLRELWEGLPLDILAVRLKYPELPHPAQDPDGTLFRRTKAYHALEHAIEIAGGPDEPAGVVYRWGDRDVVVHNVDNMPTHFNTWRFRVDDNAMAYAMPWTVFLDHILPPPEGTE
jgi:hypothetical protein